MLSHNTYEPAPPCLRHRRGRRSVLGDAIAAAMLLVTTAQSPAQCDPALGDLLLGNNTNGNDFLGADVDISGDVAIVGAYGAEGNVPNSGAAYIFRRSGGQWVQEQRLMASDGQPGDHFGLRVALSDDVAMVAARNGFFPVAEYSWNDGVVYIYRHDGQQWNQEAKLESALDEKFGIAIDIAGETALVGSWTAPNVGPPRAYVYRHANGQWLQEHTILAPEAPTPSTFGFSVSLWGGLAMIGDPDRFQAHIYQFDGVEWAPEHTVQIFQSEFADDLCISGDVAAITAQSDSSAGTASGAVYVLSHDGNQWGDPIQLNPSDSIPGGNFGRAVAVQGDRMLVGGVGSAYLFHRDFLGQWTELAKLDGPSGFGMAVAMSGNHAIGGSWTDGAAGANSGSANIITLGCPDLCTDTWWDSFDSGIWYLGYDVEMLGFGAQPALSGGKLRLDQPYGFSWSAVRFDPAWNVMCGDFDVHVDFEAGGASLPFGIPPEGARFLGISLLRADDLSFVANLERYNTAGGPCLDAGEYYKIWTDDGDDCLSDLVAGNQDTGGLRIVRTGTTYAFFRLNPDTGGWIYLGMLQGTSDEVVVRLFSGSVGFTGLEAAFDNLIIEEPAPEIDEACCFADGTCADLGPTDCLATVMGGGGDPQGPGTDCATTTCPAEPACGPGAGDCCSANGTAGCDDVSCCQAVCASDSFCCDTEWDAWCVFWAQSESLCDCGATEAPVNDHCDDAILVTPGTLQLPGSTTSATADEVPGDCGVDGTPIGVWYTTIGTGNAMYVTTCSPQTNFDTRLSVYTGGGCQNLACVVSNEDDPWQACGSESVVTWCSESGATYWVMVHGNAEVGEFLLSVSDIPGGPACGACCSDDGTCLGMGPVDCNSVGGTYQGEGTHCASDCIPESPCGDPEAGNCFEANWSPGCNDEACCQAVCAIDSFCCDVEWDDLCTSDAYFVCANPANPADTNGDGTVDVQDLVAVVLAWADCPAPCPEDVNGDGLVDVQDLIAVVLAWGQ